MGLDSRVQEGTELPPVAYAPCDRQNMIRMAIFLRDTNPLHLDRVYAMEKGFPDVVQQGNLNVAFLVRLITDWVGTAGHLEKMAVRLTANVFPGDVLTNGGRVIRRYRVGDAAYIDCDLRQQNSRGLQTLSATATVRLF